MNELPNSVYHNGVEIAKESRSNNFSDHLDRKIRDLLEDISADEMVYNGRRKLDATNKLFHGHLFS
jgi:hypothetical protein